MIAPILKPTEEVIARAAATLDAAGLVGMPTETVYGLAADARAPEVIARLYAAKGRPHFNPLIAHIADLDMARREGVFHDQALALATLFWPGPLTLVVARADTGRVCDLACAGLDSVALRIPHHPVARDLIRAFGSAIAAPSANPSGRISPTCARHVQMDMGHRLDMIVDGGPCTSGLESTIIDARGPYPVLLRPGPLVPEQIEAVWPGLKQAIFTKDAPHSPGQLLRHYAPDAQLRLNAKSPMVGESYLGFGHCQATLNLSPDADLLQAAANLFTMLRQLDHNHDRIAVAPIPDNGLGIAINDRLRRAAHR